MRPRHTSAVLDRPRLVLFSWALLSFLLFGVVLVAVVQGWGPVKQFDQRGSPAVRVRRRLGLAGRAAAGHRGHLRDHRDDDHDGRRGAAHAAPRSPAGRALHRRRHGGDLGGVHRHQAAGRSSAPRVAGRAVPALLQVVPVGSLRVRDGVRRDPDRPRRDARTPRQHAPAALRADRADDRRGLPGPGAPRPALPLRRGRGLPARDGHGGPRTGGLQPAPAQPCGAAAGPRDAVRVGPQPRGRSSTPPRSRTSSRSARS